LASQSSFSQRQFNELSEWQKGSPAGLSRPNIEGRYFLGAGLFEFLYGETPK